MKTKFIIPKMLTLLLFSIGCILQGCTPDKETESLGPVSISQNTGGNNNECDYCTAPMPIMKGSGGAAVTFGNLKVCQEGDQICFYYEAMEGRRITAIDLGFFRELEDGQVNPSPTNFQITEKNIHTTTHRICVAISDIEDYITTNDQGVRTVLIATNAQLTGSRGGNPGGQGWVGDLTLDGKYPFDRTFTFTICEEDEENGKEKCNKTQGYWKTHGPGNCQKGNNDNVWPVDGLTIGTVYYNNEAICAILNNPVRGNGLISLAHQLIAAEFNKISYCTPDNGIIARAHNLIRSLVIPPIGGGSLSTSEVSELVTLLTAYNESGACGKCPKY